MNSDYILAEIYILAWFSALYDVLYRDMLYKFNYL